MYSGNTNTHIFWLFYLHFLFGCIDSPSLPLELIKAFIILIIMGIQLQFLLRYWNNRENSYLEKKKDKKTNLLEEDDDSLRVYVYLCNRKK